MLRLAFVLILLATPLRAEISIFDVRSQLVQFLLSQVSTPGSFEVTVETVDSPESGVTRLGGLKVSDAQGVWIEAEEVSLSWNASRLLSGELDVPRIYVRDMVVSRGPAPGSEAPELKPAEPDPAASPFDWPRAPIAVILRELRLENVFLAEPVLGHAIRFDATGRAEDQGDIQSATLSITRIDETEGRIALDYLRDFDAGTLRIDLRAEEAAGGLVATLAGLPEDSASRVSLSGDGPREEWILTFEAESERVYEATGNATVDWAAPISVAAEFDLVPGPELGEDLRAILAPRATLSARVSEADGVVTLERVEIEAPALFLDASGTFARAESRFDLALDMSGGRQLARLAGDLALRGLSFDGRIAGTPEDFTATGLARIEGLESPLADARLLMVAMEARRDGPVTGLKLDGTGEGVRLDRLGPELLGEIGLFGRARLEGGTLTLTETRLTSAPLTATLDGTAATDGRSADLGYRIDIPDLGPVAAAYGQALTGTIEAGGRLRLADGRPSVELLGELRDFSTDIADLGSVRLRATAEQDPEATEFSAEIAGRGIRIDRLTPDILGEARITLEGFVAGPEVTLRNAALSSEALTASLSGRIDSTEMTGAIGYMARTGDLGPIAAAYGVEAEGVVAAEGIARLDGPGALRLEGAIEAVRAAAAGIRFEDLTLSHDLGFGETISGRLALDGTTPDLGPLDLSGELTLDGDRLEVAGLSLQALGLSAEGDIAADLSGPLAEGALRISGPLGTLGRFLGTPLDGSVDGRLTLAMQGGRQDATLSLTARGLEAAGVSLASLSVEAGVADALGRPVLRLEAAGREMLAAPLTLDALSLTARGPLSALETTVDAEGRLEADPVTLSAAAVLSAPEPLRAQVSRLDLSLAGTRVRQAGPLSVAYRGAVLSAEGIDLAIGKAGRLAGSLTVAPSGLAGDLTATALDLTLAERFANAGITAGQLDARAVFDTRPGRATAVVSAEIARLRLADLEGFGRPVSGEARVTWDGRAAAVSARVRPGRGAPLELDLTLPLRPAGGLVALVPDGPLSGRVRWQGDVAALWILLPLPDQELTGPGRIDLSVSGTPRAPILGGDVAIEGGRFQDLTAGMVLTDIRLNSRIEEGRALILDLAAKDGAEGQVAARARIELGEGTRIDATVTARDAVLVRRDDLTARVTADIALAGPVSNLALTGRIGIDRAEVRLVDASPPAIVDLGPVRVKGDDAPEGDTARTGGVTLDLRVEAPANVFVRGRGLDSEWRMDLSIEGTASQPRVTGRVERIRGRFDLLGRPFDLVEGRVDFQGGRVIDPDLNVVLERSANDITGRIAVTGRARDPEIAFSSSPVMPDDEVLPRLLFGTSKQALSAGQALQLAAGINTLRSGRPGLLDTAREALGVDVLQVDPGEEGTSVTLGRNVAPGVFLGAKRELEEEGDSAVTVEIDLFDGVKIDGEAGTESSSIGLEWSRDF